MEIDITWGEEQDKQEVKANKTKQKQNRKEKKEKKENLRLPPTMHRTIHSTEHDLNNIL